MLTALCAAEILPLGDEPPEWLPLFPPGEVVRGTDGRAWRIRDRAALVASLNARKLPVVLDENHAEFLRARKGEPSPALGRFRQYEVRDNGSIWGRLDWTPRGVRRFKDRAYTGVSPALNFDTRRAAGDILGDVTGLHSVGLVNAPNFVDLPALNSQEKSQVEFTAEHLSLLGLPEDANAEAIEARLKELDAASKPAPVAVAPNAAELSEAFATALAAAVKPLSDGLDDLRNKVAPNAHKVALNAVVDEAVRDGKIAPAHADHYREKITPERLDGFRSWLETAPVVAPTQPVALNADEGPVESADEYLDPTDPEERRIIAGMGFDPDKDKIKRSA